jgi:predicted nucleic acid-binding Zn ribbon protein
MDLAPIRYYVCKRSRRVAESLLMRDFTEADEIAEAAHKFGYNCGWCGNVLRENALITIQRHQLPNKQEIPIPVCESCSNIENRRKFKQPGKRCIVCNQTFTPKRVDAKTCSNRCRRKLYEQNRANKELAPPMPITDLTAKLNP